MNVLQINLSDYSATGGTGIVMYRLHEALKQANLQSNILCLVPELENSGAIYFERSLPVKIIERLLLSIGNELGLYDAVRFISTANICNRPCYQEADVINLHCIHGVFLSYLGLPWLTQKPTVYTLHDMWAFSGHCHYSYDCERWKDGCGKCPYPDTPDPIKRDNTSIEWKLKDWTYSRSRLHVVTPSKWMYNQAKFSMLNRFEIHHIPYGIDTKTYRPLDQELCRFQLGITGNKKVLMFNAMDMKDNRKGGDLLLSALDKLPTSLKAEILLLTMGKNQLNNQLDIETLNLGFVSDDDKKCVIFNAADIFVFPTRADNSPLVLYESLACGTPIVSFDIGGVSDLVRPGITGILAEAKNVEQLRDCIQMLLEDDSLRLSMSPRCRDIATQDYSLELYRQRYTNLYRQAIQERS